jgi:hypothetical protein
LNSFSSASYLKISRFFEGRPAVFKFERGISDIDSKQNFFQWRKWEKEVGARLRTQVQAELVEREVRSEDIHLSSSHTRSRAGERIVAVVGSDHRVGVDLEDRNRSVSEKVAARIQDVSETRFGLTPIELWVIKEAAFKANPRNAGTLIPQYRLIDWVPNLDKGGGVGEVHHSVEGRLKVLLIPEDLWHLALARVCDV